MIQSVKAAAPNAKIVVTGYPYLFDPVAPVRRIRCPCSSTRPLSWLTG